jgi:putative aldouronate transport system substrate-binding protein
MANFNLRTAALWSTSFLAIGALVLSACSNGYSDRQLQAEEPPKTGETPFEFSLMSPYFTVEPPPQNSEVMKIIEDYTKTKINITWVPSTTYDDKVNANIAANTLPQALLVQNNKSPGTINAIRSGMFWELDPYLKDFPNLNQMNKIVFNNISVDGKIYGLYRYRTLARNGFVFRKDWLDNLNLKEPTTIDELYQVLKAFTFNDPDQNGKQDTIGMSVTNGVTPFLIVANLFGAPNGWEVKDGKLSPDFMTKEFLDSIKFFKKLYDEKIINQDFAVANTQVRYDLVNNGKAGMYFSVLGDAMDKHANLYKLNPQAQLDVGAVLKGDKGDRVLATSGYSGVFMFPKSSVKTEADLKNILGAFDKMNDKPIANLFQWGIEGKHYKLDNGKPVRTDENAYNDEVKTIRQLTLYDLNKFAIPGTLSALEEKINTLFEVNEKIAVSNPAESLISNTQSEIGADLDKIINDARVKFIMGVIDENGWNQAIESWLKAGGSNVIKEMSEEYAKSKK